MSIPPTFLVFVAFVRHYKFLAIEKMGMSEGEIPLKSWKNAIFKLNLQNLVHIFCLHFTENPLFFSQWNIGYYLCLFLPPFHFSFMILAIIMSIPLKVSCFNAFAELL